MASAEMVRIDEILSRTEWIVDNSASIAHRVLYYQGELAKSQRKNERLEGSLVRYEARNEELEAQIAELTARLQGLSLICPTLVASISHGH